MARTAAVLVCACACLLPLAAAMGGGSDFVAQQDTSYPQLAPVKGQWGISVGATKGADKGLFSSQDGCNATSLSAPCMQPPMSAQTGDKLRFDFSLSGPLRTIDNLTATALVFRACYTAPSTADRPWRKPSTVIDKDKSCPFVVGSSAPNASTYTFTWSVPKNMTKATWYAQALTICANGTGTSYCQYDSSANTTQWGTVTIDSTPKGLVAATAVCSTLGPLFLAAFFIKDVLLKKRQ